ncbi:MAG: rhodanese-like domain-containing protein [Bacteroidetes bacterium]|nr:MAG: rhodanese-like domain-containing protein [Bacteroidota bacterium]
MNTRVKFSVILICIGIILALLPLSTGTSFTVKPRKLLTEVLDAKCFLSVDQVAKLIVAEDSSVQIIDLRSPEEFKKMNIPGSINIPYNELINKDPGSFLNNVNIKNILYSNGDLNSSYALVIAKGLNYKTTYVMKGGLNEWFDIVMNSSFKGEIISARENALFETRTRARKLFTQMNSLPDSLKLKFIQAKHISAKKLDGGCE